MIPKFRAYDEETETMFNVLGFDLDDNEIWSYDQSYELNKCKIMQSTGLKDKNGVEIYEGDMVKIDQRAPYDSHIPNDSVNEIVYKDSAFCVKEIRNVVDIEWPIIAGLYYIVDEEFEVISNIYENLGL